MSKRYRLFLLVLSSILLIIIGLLIERNLMFLIESFWFSSGVLMMIMLSLIDQPYFSKDSNIFVNSVTASISLLLVELNERDFMFYIFVCIIVYLLFSSYVLIWIRKSPLYEENKVVQFVSRINRNIGRPETLFSALFIWGAINQYKLNSLEFNMLFLYWLLFSILNIPEIAKTIDSIFAKKGIRVKDYIGIILGVQSKNTFLVKLEENRGAIRIFDFVEFKYSIDRVIRQGLICDVYYLNNEKWIKVISNNEIESIFEGKSIYEKHNLDSVYLIKEIPDNNYLTRFVGIVTENSTISNVRFVFNSKICISEGQLLEVSQDGNKVLYQIIEGRTKIESLENKNQTDLIVGEAVQLGKWNYDKCQFEKHGWVPSINTPIYIASAIDETSINDDEYVVGHLPNTNYPVILNKSLAITHHTAIVGVTGTGKSVFARNLIREFLKDNNTKVICIDFTNEYENKFSDLSLKTIVDDTLSNTLFNKIDKIEMIVGKNYNKDNDNSLKLRKEVEKSMNGKLVEFLKGKEQLSIFELPHVENTSGVLSYTKTFFRLLFNNAKKEYNYGKRVCLVLEEAHTIIPEWNFSGVSDKISQPLLNSIAQIALQGRKYNIGLIVIAQRTANVSKTILTQCNSIVSFQEFDKTSSDFLANYFGDEIVKSLPNLRFRQAIAAGKAFRSNTPMIFEVPEIDEK